MGCCVRVLVFRAVVVAGFGIVYERAGVLSIDELGLLVRYWQCEGEGGTVSAEGIKDASVHDGTWLLS